MAFLVWVLFMTVFVVCHNSLPGYNLPEGSKIVWLNARPPNNNRGLEIINGYDYFENPEMLHEKLSGSFASFVIAKHVSETKSEHEAVTIWQYRRFVTRNKYGSPSGTYFGMHLVKSDEAKTINPSEEICGGSGFFVSTPIMVDSVLLQYGTVHNAQDILKYACSALDVGVLKPLDLAMFFNNSTVFPGGVEFGTFPTDWWLKTIGDIEAVSMNFIANYEVHQPDHPYQKRALGFCQERIGSYLLVDKLLKIYGNAVSSKLIGTMHVVTDDGEYIGGLDERNQAVAAGE